MAVQCVWASIDERGKATGGAAGDQTGNEVRKGSWYQFGQTYVLRPKKAADGVKMANAAIATAANNNIGYDQGQRTTFYTAASKVGWDPSKITTKCETDCSAAVAVWCKAAGISISKDVYTGNLRSALLSTGKFESHTGDGWTNTDKNLKKGDIILKPYSHVIIAVSDATPVASSATSSVSSKKSISEIAKEVVAGKWGNGDARKSKLKAAGYDYAAVQKEVNKLVSGGSGSTTKKPSYTTRTVIAKKGLNVRNKPNMSGKILRALAYGTKVNCYSSTNGWYKISATAEEYVSGQYVK